MSTEINTGSVQTAAEKPHHYTYLKEFRTCQCPLFLQHKCTQHRPFTCFNWHFMNQRRRRPVRKRDGTFSYSPDHYCTKYDETTGICPDGDDCIYLHRTTGDTERRYHLRYYKTGTCVHETDSKGNCTKNGSHCAFAHGAHDLRPALYDIREVQSIENTDNVQMTPVGTPSSLEKDRMLLDDPNWNDTTFVLACYKTEPCKRPPRLCRQGYACPQFHNSRDRRRSPKKYKYRSTPCPHVKHGDDWGDPGQCDTGDECSYCHTRTEQQFHPEIYKSTKCNDMSQTAYCPRGPFCAFAHVDQEMTGPRDLHMGTDNSLAAFVSNVLPNMPEIPVSQALDTSSRAKVLSASWGERGLQCMGGVTQQHQSSAPVLALHQRGSLRVRHHSQTEVDCRHHSLLFGLGELTPSSTSQLPAGLTPPQNAVMFNHATTFYPAGEMVESVIGSALEEMNMDDFDLSSIDKELEKDETNSMSSSYGAGLPQAYLGATSVPVNIPNHRDNHCRGSLGSLSESPSSPFGSNDHSAHLIVKNSLPRQQLYQLEHKQEQLLEQAAAAFNRQPNPGKYAAAAQPGQGSLTSTVTPHSPLVLGSPLTSSFIGPHMTKSSMSPTLASEVQRMREELMTNKAKLTSWEEGISQARNACDAWRKEAEEAITKARLVDEERLNVTKQRDEVLQQLAAFRKDLPCSWLHSVHTIETIDVLPRSKLQQMRRQLARDLERIDQTITSTTTPLCLSCQEQERTVVSLPCEHFVLCDACVGQWQDCPHCHGRIVTTRRENWTYRLED